MLLGDSRSSHSEVFLDKGVLKICSKFPEEHLAEVWFQNLILLIQKTAWKVSEYRKIWTWKNTVFGYFSLSGSSRRCSIKKLFLNISQNLLENICVEISFMIVRPAVLLKKGLWHMCFPRGVVRRGQKELKPLFKY